MNSSKRTVIPIIGGAGETALAQDIVCHTVEKKRR
jgi:hypothetical protein